MFDAIPVSNAYSIPFRARCVECGAWQEAHNLGALLAPADPFTYACLTHLEPGNRQRIERAYDEQFRALSPAEKHRARVRLYGTAAAAEIARRAGDRIL
jgi:hypothetical protein